MRYKLYVSHVVFIIFYFTSCSHCSEKRVPWILWPLRKLNLGYLDRLKYMCYKYQYSKGRQSIHHTSWQTCCRHSIIEEEDLSPQAANNSNPMPVDEFDMEEVLSQPLRSAEVSTILAFTSFL